MDMTTGDIIGIIPARGGSKSVPRKNISPLLDKPLIYYSIMEASKSSYLSGFFVSTEDSEIAQIVRGYGVEVIERPRELAQDDTPSLPVYQDFFNQLQKAKGISPQVIVVLQPTSPLRIAEDIDGAIRKFMKTDCDSVVSVCEVEHPIQWMYTLNGDRMEAVFGSAESLKRRQDAPGVYRLNGAVYVIHRNVIMDENKVLGNDTRAYIMPAERSIDIDSVLDFKLAEILLKERGEAA